MRAAAATAWYLQQWIRRASDLEGKGKEKAAFESHDHGHGHRHDHDRDHNSSETGDGDTGHGGGSLIYSGMVVPPLPWTAVRAILQDAVTQRPVQSPRLTAARP